MYQYSVVVKGIERKLTEMGFDVEIMTENFEKVDEYSEFTDTFIIYLPADIMDSKIRKSELADFCERIQECDGKLIIIGEKKYHHDLDAIIPIIDNYCWFDRPVDVAQLGNAIKNGSIDLASQSEKKRILIVDDDASYAGMVREWIKDIYRADVVTAGMQAITFLLKNKVDLVLLDYEMPVVDGPQVLQMLRQEPTTKDIPVVFLTGGRYKGRIKQSAKFKA